MAGGSPNLDAVRGLFRERFEQAEAEHLELIADKVVSLGRRGDDEFALVWFMRDGRVDRVQEFDDHEKALERAALDEIRKPFTAEGIRGLVDGTFDMPPAVAEHVVMENLDEAPGRWEGHEGFREWARVTFAAIDDCGFEFGDTTPIPPNVLVTRVIGRGRGREGGIDVEVPLSTINGFRDGEFVYCKAFLDHDAAVEAGKAWAEREQL